MKLNNKGQTLIFFVILIPLLLMLLAIVVDVSLMHREKIKLENTTKIIIKNVYDNKMDSDINQKIKNLYNKNDINSKNVKIRINDDYLQIGNQYEIDSIFGKIIGFKKDRVKVNIKGYKKNGKIVFTKE